MTTLGDCGILGKLLIDSKYNSGKSIEPQVTRLVTTLWSDLAIYTWKEVLSFKNFPTKIDNLPPIKKASRVTSSDSFVASPSLHCPTHGSKHEKIASLPSRRAFHSFTGLYKVSSASLACHNVEAYILKLLRSTLSSLLTIFFTRRWILPIKFISLRQRGPQGII